MRAREWKHRRAHRNARLTAWEVLEIRRLLSQGVRQYVIAEEYEVHTSTVNDINTGRTWSWLRSDTTGMMKTWQT